MWDSFEQSLARFRELERKLADPDVAADRPRYTQMAKEHGSLAKQIKPYVEFKRLEEEAAAAEELAKNASDPDMIQYAAEELTGLKSRVQAMRNKLEELLLMDPSEDFTSLIVEIRAGTGGDEAALFA